VYQELVAAVEAQHDDLQKSALGIETQAKLTCWIVLVQVADEYCVFSGMDSIIRFNSVFAGGIVGPSRDVGTDGCPDRFRTTDMVMLGAVCQGREKSFVDTHGYHLPGAVPDRLSTTFAKLLDVVTSFSFVCPVPEVVLGDGLAVDLLHG